MPGNPVNYKDTNKDKLESLYFKNSEKWKLSSTWLRERDFDTMLNDFAGIQKVSDESLGRDETPRHTSHEI